MDRPLKERLLGALILVSLAAIFVPMLFDEPQTGQVTLASSDLPVAPDWAASAVEFTVPEAMRTVQSTTAAFSTPAQNATPPEQVAEVSAEKIAPLIEESEADITMPSPALDQTPQQVAKTAQVLPKAPTSIPVPASAATTESAIPKKQMTTPATAVAAIPTLESPEAYAVQLATFSNKDNAKVLMEKLRAKGYDAYVRDAFGDGRRLRVLVGPRIERKHAEQLRDKLSAEFALNGFIIPYQPIEG